MQEKTECFLDRPITRGGEGGSKRIQSRYKRGHKESYDCAGLRLPKVPFQEVTESRKRTPAAEEKSPGLKSVLESA